jgi:hypothetical protein
LRVVFLDFDGVLVLRPNLRWPSREKVELLNGLLERSGAQVVVSSTWRIGRCPLCLQEILDESGFKGTVFGKTPRGTRETRDQEKQSTLSLGVERGSEIDSWLAEHPAVDAYVVLDDDSDRGPIPEWRWILTKFEEGLTEAQVERAIEVLAKPFR